MNATAKFVNPLEDPDWDRRLTSHEQATIFHSAAWAKVLAKTYNFTPCYYSHFEEERIVALLPMMEIKSRLTGRRAVSLPFSDYCTPFLSRGLPLHEAVSIIRNDSRAASWKFLEIRDDHGVETIFEPSHVYLGHKLDLRIGEEKLYTSLKSNTKRNIKKAVKQGVTTKHLTSPQAMKRFFELNCLTRKKHGLPPQPWRFFKNLHEHVIEKGHGFVQMAYHEGNAIAGAVYLHFNGKAVYKYGASDANYQMMRPNNLVMWEAIQYYARNGFQSFCFGKTDPGNDGLRRFKMGWGAEEFPIRYYKFDFQKDVVVKEKPRLEGVHTKIFSRTPMPVLKALGSIMYRHVA